MKRILWFTEWFPTRIEPYAGDSIERHALAASLYNDIEIIHIKKDPKLKWGTTSKENRNYNNHCRAVIYFYPSAKGNWAFLDTIVSNYYFLYLYRKAIREYEQRSGRPSGVQVNVTLKNGIIALLYKWACNVPYVVAEGWSLFLPESKPQFREKNPAFRWLAKKVLKGSSRLLTVSHRLGKVLCEQFSIKAYTKVPNVVDDRIFYPSGTVPDGKRFRLIHISLLGYPKDPETLLEAVKKVASQRSDVGLRIHGPVKNDLIRLSEQLGLKDHIAFLPECPQPELAESIRECHALVLYSRYETFGNVIIEANACGLPVITSDYPTFDELITNGVNGIKAPGQNPDHLAAAILDLMDHYEQYDRNAIAATTTQRYSYSTVGKLFDEVYQQVFSV